MNYDLALYGIKKLNFKDNTLDIDPTVKGAKDEKLIYIQKQIYLPEIKTPITITIGVDEDPLEKNIAPVNWASLDYLRIII